MRQTAACVSAFTPPVNAVAAVTTSAPPQRPLRWAVVGLGYWGPNLLRVLAETPARR